MSTGVAAQKYAELRSKIAEARKTMEDTAKGLFIEMSTELFNENPTLMSFGWTQYTPYFNDGEECVFRCGGDYPTVSMILDGNLLSYDTNSSKLLINGERAESADELIRTFTSMNVDSFSKNGKQYAFDKTTKTVTVDGNRVKTYTESHDLFEPLEEVVSAFMNVFEDEDMKVMFGDHVSVEVKRNGSINIEEYEHE